METAAEYARRFACIYGFLLVLPKVEGLDDALQPKVGEAAYPYTYQSGYECMLIYSDQRGPFGRNLSLMAKVKAAIKSSDCDAPLVVAGGIGTFSLAEQALQQGIGDLIGVARGTLVDPDLWLKVRAGKGHEVRRAIPH